MGNLSLYHIQYDSISYYVEAATMKDAIDVWHCHVSREWAGEYQGDEEPESCHLVHNMPVIRRV